MKNLEEVIKKHLRTILEDEEAKHQNYMFLKEHDWAQDHIAEAKSLLDQVFDFLMNQTKNDDSDIDETYLSEEYQIDESKNCPTDPAKWAASKAAAKSKFDVYPSAYANGWAAKNYKSKGGGWKKCKK